MRTPRVFVDLELETNAPVNLPKEQSHYLIRVLRKHLDTPVILFNGQGGEFHGVIKNIDRNTATVQLHKYSSVTRESPLKVSLGIGLSKGERMDWVIQKTTELGVQHITPLFTKYCDVKLNEKRLQNRLLHWNRITVSACEQSGRTRLPVIDSPLPVDDWLYETESDTKLVLHPGGGNTDLMDLKKPTSLSLLVGPEGGLSKQEIQEAIANGFLEIGLGPRILRTETAPVAILGLVGYLWGDMLDL